MPISKNKHNKTKTHFSKYIVRYPYRVIPGIVLGQPVFLCLGLTHSESNALGIREVKMRGVLQLDRRFINFHALDITAATRLRDGKIAFDGRPVHPCRFLSSDVWQGLSHIYHLVIESF